MMLMQALLDLRAKARETKPLTLDYPPECEALEPRPEPVIVAPTFTITPDNDDLGPCFG